jgi:uncharacterized Tic20 family protein
MFQSDDFERERASNIYLMSIVVVIIGLPLPILNLIATVIVFFSNRNSTFFVKWHSTQALLSQIFLMVINSIGLSWTLSAIFGSQQADNNYIAYILTLVLFNIIEFIGTLAAAISVRKGKHISFWFFGPLTNLIYKIG